MNLAAKSKLQAEALFRIPYRSLEKRNLIWIDNDRMSGEILLYGTRVPLSVFMHFLDADQLTEFHDAYPTISKDQVIQILGALSTAGKRKPTKRRATA